MKSKLAMGAVLALVAGCAAVDPVQDGGFRMTQAWQQHEAAPLLSPVYGKALTSPVAYRIQHLALEQLLQGRAPAGFKAGLTNPGSQQQFGATEPVAGVLPPGSGLQGDEEGLRTAVKDYRQGMVEVEVGFRFAHRLKHALPDVQSLKAEIAEILPAVELPDLGHAGTAPVRAVDLIAANVYARHFIAGAGRAPGLTDPNAVAVTLYRDGEEVNIGTALDVSGDQWQALLWLVNRTIESGWTIEPGQVLITGAMGKPVPLRAGLYVADFGRFGRIEWTAE